MKQPYPTKHRTHLYDPVIMKSTGFTCYRCYEEFQEYRKETALLQEQEQRDFIRLKPLIRHTPTA